MRIKNILTLLFVALLVASCQKENAAKKINKGNLITAKNRDAEIKKGSPEISFTKNEYNFGTVKEGEIVETSFVLTNTGKSDLVITDAKASCGCTVPQWPRNAVKPGENALVTVKFNTTGKPNKQVKTVTLYTNTVKGRETLKLTGQVIPKKKA